MRGVGKARPNHDGMNSPSERRAFWPWSLILFLWSSQSDPWACRRTPVHILWPLRPGRMHQDNGRSSMRCRGNCHAPVQKVSGQFPAQFGIFGTFPSEILHLRTPPPCTHVLNPHTPLRNPSPRHKAAPFLHSAPQSLRQTPLAFHNLHKRCAALCIRALPSALLHQSCSALLSPSPVLINPRPCPTTPHNSLLASILYAPCNPLQPRPRRLAAKRCRFSALPSVSFQPRAPNRRGGPRRLTANLPRFSVNRRRPTESVTLRAILVL